MKKQVFILLFHGFSGAIGGDVAHHAEWCRFRDPNASPRNRGSGMASFGCRRAYNPDFSSWPHLPLRQQLRKLGM
jgi:hypothetical protein